MTSNKSTSNSADIYQGSLIRVYTHSLFIPLVQSLYCHLIIVSIWQHYQHQKPFQIFFQIFLFQWKIPEIEMNASKCGYLGMPGSEDLTASTKAGRTCTNKPFLAGAISPWDFHILLERKQKLWFQSLIRVFYLRETPLIKFREKKTLFSNKKNS